MGPKAAEQDVPGAQYLVGEAYRQGRGVAQSNGAAAEWFRKAVDRGYGPAQYGLGVLYLRGHGVPESRVEAYKWIYLSAQRMQGKAREEAIDALGRVGNAMSEIERNRAMERVRQWTPGRAAAQ